MKVLELSKRLFAAVLELLELLLVILSHYLNLLFELLHLFVVAVVVDFSKTHSFQVAAFHLQSER